MTFTEIKNRIYFLTGTDSNSFPVADLTSMVNRASEYVSSLILMADLRWRWDDSNQTDLPIATAALVASQQDYSISTAHLILERIEVKDENGNWHLLTPFDQSRLKGDRKRALDEYLKTAGLPREYDVVGNSIFLYPKPSYSQAASLKIHFARGPVAFTTADDTETPGFNTLFHDLLPLKVSYEYSALYHLDRANFLLAKVQKGEEAIQDFYAKRQTDARPRLTVSQEGDGARRSGRGGNYGGISGQLGW